MLFCATVAVYCLMYNLKQWHKHGTIKVNAVPFLFVGNIVPVWLVPQSVKPEL